MPELPAPMINTSSILLAVLFNSIEFTKNEKMLIKITKIIVFSFLMAVYFFFKNSQKSAMKNSNSNSKF